MGQKIKRGDIIDVKITGIQPYGAFASLPDNSTGLIHISEISDKFVKSIDSFVKVGQSIKVKVHASDGKIISWLHENTQVSEISNHGEQMIISCKIHGGCR